MRGLAAERERAADRKRAQEAREERAARRREEEEEVVARPAVETYYDDGEWKSRRQGASRAFAVGGSKVEQVAKGREAARRDGTEHIIKTRNGRISERNSYGDDPAPPYDR